MQAHDGTRTWAEAERYDVVPLNNQLGRHGDRRHRHDRCVYHPGIGSLPEHLAPNLRNRAFRRVVIDGIGAAHRDRAGEERAAAGRQ